MPKVRFCEATNASPKAKKKLPPNKYRAKMIKQQFLLAHKVKDKQENWCSPVSSGYLWLAYLSIRLESPALCCRLAAWLLSPQHRAPSLKRWTPHSAQCSIPKRAARSEMTCLLEPGIAKVTKATWAFWPKLCVNIVQAKRQTQCTGHDPLCSERSVWTLH